MKNKRKFNLKIVSGILLFLMVLVLIWLLLMGRLESLLTENMEKQVARQAEVVSDQLEDKLGMELELLQNISVYVSSKMEEEGDIGSVIASVNSVWNTGETGILELNGNAVYGRQLPFPEFSGIKEAFHGNASVCYNQTEGFLFTVPVYKGSNVKYVIYRLYDMETFWKIYQVSCYGEAGKLLIAEQNGQEVIPFQTWEQEELELLFSEAYQTAFDKIDKKMYSAKSAAVYHSVNGREQFVFVSDIGQYGLYLIGTVEEAAISGESLVISQLVFWVFGLLILLFAIGTVYLLGIEAKAKESAALREAKQAAEQANRAKSDFLASMSHEIRTPINAVMGMNEMVLRECEDETIRTYALNIQSASQNLLGLINDILDFSKIESGKMELVETEYRFSALLNDVVNMIQIKTEQTNLEFHVHVQESIPDKLFGDEGRIRQIMINILNNAVKYTRAGSVSFTVNGTMDGDRLLLEIMVADTGIGIKEEDLPKLFKDFERLDRTKNRNVEGTGLGLAITKKLAAMMEGDILVSSVYGEGTTFTVLLPQVVKDPQPMGDFNERMKQAAREMKRYKESFTAKDAKILVVDDNEMNLLVATNLLKKLQMQIATCESGEACLKLLEKEHFDIVLLDHMMPGLDGMETLKLAKELRGNPCEHTTFIALTANAISGMKEKYLKAGFDDYLSKPINGAVLEEMIRKYLELHQIAICEPEEAAAQKAEAVICEEKKKDGSEQPAQSVESSRKEEDEPESLLNTTLGLGYSCNAEELYKEMLCMYADMQKEKAANIAECLEKEDWKTYTVYVHALKSTSLSIGGETVSELARQMEEAGKAIQKGENAEEKIAFIHENQEKLMTLYEKTAQEAKKYLVP